MQRKLLFVSFFLILLLGVLQQVANKFYFYWIYWWYDSMMHFLGGLSIGFFILWIAFQFNILRADTTSARKIIAFVILFMIIIGVGWEVFEYMNNLTQSTEGYGLDIRNDLIFDIIGGVTAGLIVSRMNRRKYV